ncbi:MAG: type II toxin-antitoxin system prevent-host-death family antitoxin [SAR324 cluster bacterium]|nr:type II toxin-antitoxin system prevent-host-death family antitoxin [SAR324 cluster bacterium]
MKTASVGEVQKNFAKVINRINAGEEIMITKRGKIVAKISAVSPQKKLQWPDFMKDAIRNKGIPTSELIQSNREERF